MADLARHPGLTALLARLEALASVDATTLDSWAVPRIEELGHQFHCSYRPIYDFPIWLREQFLAHVPTLRAREDAP